MQQSRQLAVLRTYDELLATLRARRVELGLSDKIIGDIAGLTSGELKHLLEPKTKTVKSIGACWDIFEALSLRIVAGEDPDALARA